MGGFSLLAFKFIDVVANRLVLYVSQHFSMFVVGEVDLVKVGRALSPAASPSTESKDDGDFIVGEVSP